jgi:hypothetical protein
MSKPNRYVTTSDIQTAVKGQEMRVLQGLDIDWTGARGHIDCPYPDHGGESDWRWDEQKNVAFCTCIGKRPGEKKRHTIFDVVMCCRGVDFEATKVYVAELIGRTDLIKTKGDDSSVYQKTDAHSLLSPPAANRDDELVWAYLGARLCVEPNLVPRPRTPVAGHRSLGYFDLSRSKKGKPKPVTSAPCAVFGQIDRDGREHAHRIYLTLDGQGKAELGIGPAGEPRDPKKSAKSAEGDNTTGRGVLWGDPESATLEIVFEGIENAAAVALALRPELDAGEVLIVSCSWAHSRNGLNDSIC